MAAKLKDGVFLGDYDAAQDVEFIMANKITRVINCAGRQVPNLWEHAGIRYLTFGWPEAGNCVIFDEKNTVLDEIFSFVEDAVEHGGAVLVHSIDGRSRAAFCSAVYFMLKYRWTLGKTLTFLQSKRADLQPRPGFMRQLRALDHSLQRVARSALGSGGGGRSVLRRFSEWDVELLAALGSGRVKVVSGSGEVVRGPSISPAATAGLPVTEEEVLLSNTFLNSKAASDEDIRSATMKQRRKLLSATTSSTTAPPPLKRRISWVDQSGRKGTKHRSVPRSPTTKRPTTERPPTPSYSSLQPAHGWTDTSSTSTMSTTTSSSSSSSSSSSLLSPAAKEAGRTGPDAHRRTSPSTVRSILRNGSKWREERVEESGEKGGSGGGGDDGVKKSVSLSHTISHPPKRVSTGRPSTPSTSSSSSASASGSVRVGRGGGSGGGGGGGSGSGSAMLSSSSTSLLSPMRTEWTPSTGGGGGGGGGGRRGFGVGSGGRLSQSSGDLEEVRGMRVRNGGGGKRGGGGRRGGRSGGGGGGRPSTPGPRTVRGVRGAVSTSTVVGGGSGGGEEGARTFSSVELRDAMAHASSVPVGGRRGGRSRGGGEGDGRTAMQEVDARLRRMAAARKARGHAMRGPTPPRSRPQSADGGTRRRETGGGGGPFGGAFTDSRSLGHSLDRRSSGAVGDIGGGGGGGGGGGRRSSRPSSARPPTGGLSATIGSDGSSGLGFSGFAGPGVGRRPPQRDAGTPGAVLPASWAAKPRRSRPSSADVRRRRAPDAASDGMSGVGGFPTHSRGGHPAAPYDVGVPPVPTRAGIGMRSRAQPRTQKTRPRRVASYY